MLRPKLSSLVAGKPLSTAVYSPHILSSLLKLPGA